MANSKKFKLTDAGIAYQKAANDKESPVTGIVVTKKGRVNIKDLKNGDAVLESLAGTQYVVEETSS